MRRVITALLTIICLSILMQSAYAIDVFLKVEKLDNGGHKEVWYDKVNKNIIYTQIYNDRYELIKREGNIPDGMVRIYKNEKLYSEVNYVNNKEEGISKWYYDSGKIKTESNLSYVNGNQEYIFKTYYENGNIKSEINYVNGLPTGLSKDYYGNGSLKSEIHYVEGYVEGTKKEYYKNGQVHYETTWKRGVQEGIEKAYYKNGQLQYEANYADGHYYGQLHEEYDENGNLKIYESIKNYVNNLFKGSNK